MSIETFAGIQVVPATGLWAYDEFAEWITTHVKHAGRFKTGRVYVPAGDAERLVFVPSFTESGLTVRPVLYRLSNGKWRSTGLESPVCFKFDVSD